MLILNGEELPLPEDINYDSILFAHHLLTHAETFGLPLPEDQEKAAKPTLKPQCVGSATESTSTPKLRQNSSG